MLNIIKKRLYIKNVKYNLPVLSTAVAYLLLDRVNAPGWIWGAVGLYLLVIWIAKIILVLTQTGVDIFDQEDPNKDKIVTKKRSNFQERLKKLAEKEDYKPPKN